MTKIEETLAADARAWCTTVNSHPAWRINIPPTVSILNQTTQPDGTVLVRAVMYFQIWEWPQSGSGWGDYYFRAVETTFLHDTKTAERTLAHHHIHVTEYQDDNHPLDLPATLAEFSKPFE